MAETELESMVVKLKGDSTSYQKMLADAGSGISSLGKTANSAWAITEKSFIQAIRSVDAMMSRTVASITNGMEGIVRVSIDAGSKIFTAWAGVFAKLTGPVGGFMASITGSIYTSLKGVVVGVDRLLAGIPSAIATTLGAVSGVLGTILAGAFGVAGAAMVAFGGEMTRVFNETMELNKSAKLLGTTILDLRAGVLWSGVAMSTFTGILGNVQVKINELKAGSVQTSREFRNFSVLAGRSVQDLAGGGWESIIEGLGAIPDASNRASVAFSILGSEADKILGAIERGGVSEAKGLAKRLGLEVDPASMRSLQQIAQFTREVEALKTGLVNQVMLGLAPIAAELSSVFSLSKTDITWIKDKVTEIALEIGRWGAIIATVFSDPKLFFEAIGIIGDAFIKMANDFWEIMTKKTDEWIGKYSYWLNPGVRFRSGPEEESLVYTPGREPTAGKSRSFMERLGDSDIMKRFDKFREDALERRNQPADALDKTKTPPIAIEKLNQSFDQLINSLKQPIDAWKQSLVDLKRFTDANKFKGRGDEQAIAAAQMFKQLRQSTGMGGTPQFAGAATAGSTEAYSAIAQFEALRDRGDIQQQMKDTLLQANRQRDLLIANGQAVIQALNKLGEKLEVEEDSDIS